MPDQEHGSAAGAQVQPQGYCLGFTGSVNTQAPQIPSGTATVDPDTEQNLELTGTKHSTQPAPHVNQPQIQATTVPFGPNANKLTKVDLAEANRRLDDSPEPSHTPGVANPPINQSPTHAPPEFRQADADTVAKAIREAMETVGKVDSDALLGMTREKEKERLAGNKAGRDTSDPSVAKPVKETEPAT